MKLTEGPTRPLLYMRRLSPSKFYKLSSNNLQELALNALFNNRDLGYDQLPTALKNMYDEHIYPKIK